MTGRFVVLHHELPESSERASHWDLLLEAGDVLRAWALDAPPRLGTTTSALGLADHRFEYLEYEGPVSGNRGTVTRQDSGVYQLLNDEPGMIRVRLAGAKFAGVVDLCLEGIRWRATFANE